jgi:hypothetical protein
MGTTPRSRISRSGDHPWARLIALRASATASTSAPGHRIRRQVITNLTTSASSSTTTNRMIHLEDFSAHERANSVSPVTPQQYPWRCFHAMQSDEVFRGQTVEPVAIQYASPDQCRPRRYQTAPSLQPNRSGAATDFTGFPRYCFGSAQVRAPVRLLGTDEPDATKGLRAAFLKSRRGSDDRRPSSRPEVAIVPSVRDGKHAVA